MKCYYDVIIVGTGIAGLFTAINIEEKRVLLISKSKLSSGSTPLAQGGIVSCIYKESHFEDTLKAGSYYNKAEAVRAIEEDSRENIEKLIALGVKFERDAAGNLKYTREGGHTENTILYAKDRTGKEIVDILIATVKSRPNIDIIEDSMVVDIATQNSRISGVEILNKHNESYTVETQSLVLATGGIGQIYLNTTNSTEATGDGIAIASKIGANIADMEFIQFHPTSIYIESEHKRFLISESMRGEGAKLINDRGERFMSQYHEMGELAPRDVVSRGIYKERARGRTVYLDIRHESAEHLKERFPTIYENCMKQNIDISKDLIEISPAEHYIMGGIETDLSGKTNIAGLYACGECACTGVHGGNRLASNSLLEGIVFGNRIAKQLNQIEVQNSELGNAEVEILPETRDKALLEYYEEARFKLKTIVEENLGIVRSQAGIDYALKSIESLQSEITDKKTQTIEYHELCNMLKIAELIAKAAIKRPKSLGAHYIEVI